MLSKKAHFFFFILFFIEKCFSTGIAKIYASTGAFLNEEKKNRVLSDIILEYTHNGVITAY